MAWSPGRAKVLVRWKKDPDEVALGREALLLAHLFDPLRDMLQVEVVGQAQTRRSVAAQDLRLVARPSADVFVVERRLVNGDTRRRRLP